MWSLSKTMYTCSLCLEERKNSPRAIRMPCTSWYAAIRGGGGALAGLEAFVGGTISVMVMPNSVREVFKVETRTVAVNVVKGVNCHVVALGLQGEREHGEQWRCISLQTACLYVDYTFTLLPVGIVNVHLKGHSSKTVGVYKVGGVGKGIVVVQPSLRVHVFFVRGVFRIQGNTAGSWVESVEVY